MNLPLQHLTVPDLWQRDAVQHLRAGRDVVVHAPTGAGKTFVFELLLPELKGQAVFTVPTRALANDKLAEWRTRGWDVGISTGDLSLNPGAKVVVATLETQRGRFLRREGPRLLVIDEYQMIGDATRGVNYELALALAPPATQLLLLSGSIANPQDVVAWLQRIGREAVLVSHDERPVSLTETDLEALPDRAPPAVRGYWPRLVCNALRADLGPLLLFAPRRNAAEELASTLAARLPSESPLALTAEQEALAGPRIAKLLRSRVAYHHSGLGYALRAGLIEPLAKNGQLRVVVATMGLAAGINFSMRSVLVTDMRYMAGNFEHIVQPDELVQMFGRAGRRGLDESGCVLFTEKSPRLLDARPRRLKRATQLDWPTLIAVMRAAADAGHAPFAAALALNQRLFTPHDIPLGIERSLQTGPRPCGFIVDMERARFIRRSVAEMLNSRDEWQARTAPEQVRLGDALVRAGDRWRTALSVANNLDGIGFGQLCRLKSAEGEKFRRYGREIILGTRRDGGLDVAPWLRSQLGLRHLSVHGLQSTVLANLDDFIPPARRARCTVSAAFPRGDQLVVQLDYSAHCVQGFRDSHGTALLAPPLREIGAPCCESCDQREWCASAPISVSPAWAWRKLGLIAEDGTPTRRGIIFSFFHHGEGLAIAAALEDGSYPVGDLVFDLANLRASPRFSGDEAPHAGRLGALCQTVFARADFEGYLSMGVPPEYGDGASGIVREFVEHGTPRSKLLTEWLRPGDIERALIEWRSLLRHIADAPDFEWDRWRELQHTAAGYVEQTESPTTLAIPALTAAQRRNA